MALQISRAVKDIYGEEVLPEEVSARHLAVDAAGRVVPGGAVSVWFLCGLILFLFYRMAESRFIRVESVPGDDIRVSLIERPIGASNEDGAYAR